MRLSIHARSSVLLVIVMLIAGSLSAGEPVRGPRGPRSSFSRFIAKILKLVETNETVLSLPKP